MSGQVQNDLCYTQEQIDAYLSYISFPIAKYRKITPETTQTEHGLAYLTALQKYQLAKVPFENLILHYSKDHRVSVDKDDIFEKIVGTKSGRGGYCMENNMFFGTVLKTMGFDVFAIGGRVLLESERPGW